MVINMKKIKEIMADKQRALPVLLAAVAAILGIAALLITWFSQFIVMIDVCFVSNSASVGIILTHLWDIICGIVSNIITVAPAGLLLFFLIKKPKKESKVSMLTIAAIAGAAICAIGILVQFINYISMYLTLYSGTTFSFATLFKYILMFGSAKEVWCLIIEAAAFGFIIYASLKKTNMVYIPAICLLALVAFGAFAAQASLVNPLGASRVLAMYADNYGMTSSDLRSVLMNYFGGNVLYTHIAENIMLNLDALYQFFLVGAFSLVTINFLKKDNTVPALAEGEVAPVLESTKVESEEVSENIEESSAVEEVSAEAETTETAPAEE